MFYNNLNNPNKQRIAALYNDNNTLSKSDEDYLLSKAIEGINGLTKAEELGILSGMDDNDLEKGRIAMPIGAHAHWGGIDYLKTASGWKPAGKIRGHVKENHDHLHKNEDKDKDHHEMAMDAGKMEESEWTKKHGSTLHAKYKAVHDYLHKPKAEKKEVKPEEKSDPVEKTRSGNDVTDEHKKSATEIVNKLKNGEVSNRLVELPNGQKVKETIQPNKGKDKESYSRYHTSPNGGKDGAVKQNAYLEEHEVHRHLSHSIADHKAKNTSVEEKKEDPKPEEVKPTPVAEKKAIDLYHSGSVSDYSKEAVDKRDKETELKKHGENLKAGDEVVVNSGYKEIEHRAKVVSANSKNVTIQKEGNISPSTYPREDVKSVTKHEVDTKKDPKIITDQADKQKITNAINEGSLMLRANSSNGKKLTPEHREMIQNQVNRDRAKIGLPAKTDETENKEKPKKEAPVETKENHSASVKYFSDKYDKEIESGERTREGIVEDLKYELNELNQTKPEDRLDNFDKHVSLYNGLIKHLDIKDGSEKFEVGTPARFMEDGKELSGEVVMHNGKKSISLYKDANYSGDSKRVRVPDWKDVKTLYSDDHSSNKKEEPKEDPAQANIKSIADKAYVQYNNAPHVDKAKLKKRMQDAITMHENGLKNNGKGLDETMIQAAKEFLKKVADPDLPF